MAKFTIYKLHFTSPLHLGYAREDYSLSLKTIQSDVLYAALTSCLAKIGMSIPDDGDLGFTISSLFPFYQKDTTSDPVFFFPRPRKVSQSKNENNNRQNSRVELAKQIKSVLWLDTCYFQKTLQTNDDIFENRDDIKGDYLTHCAIDEDFIRSQVVPRVSVSRSGKEDATPFYMDKISFEDYAGLFFLTVGDDRLLRKAMDVLQYEGIGTDRNVGNGFFTYETDELSIEFPDESEYSLSMSMFIPESKEQLENMIEGDKVAYDFIRRGGWITTPPYHTFRKNIIYAFTPASIFKTNMQVNTVLGKIVDLKPDLKEVNEHIPHAVWRSGKSLFLPIKL
jgi:CRISPR-associated protein Csm4